MKNFKKIVAILGVFVLVANYFMPLTVDAGNGNGNGQQTNNGNGNGNGHGNGNGNGHGNGNGNGHGNTETPTDSVNDPAGPANPGDTPAGPANPGDTPAGPANPGDTPAGPANPGDTPAGPANPGDTPAGPANPGEGPVGPANPGEGPVGPANPGEGPAGPANPGDTPAGPANPGEGPVGPNGTWSNENSCKNTNGNAKKILITNPEFFGKNPDHKCYHGDLNDLYNQYDGNFVCELNNNQETTNAQESYTCREITADDCSETEKFDDTNNQCVPLTAQDCNDNQEFVDGLCVDKDDNTGGDDNGQGNGDDNGQGNGDDNGQGNGDDNGQGNGNTGNNQSNNWGTSGGGYSGGGSHRGSSSSDSSEEIVLRGEVLLGGEDTSASESDLARKWAVENGLIDSEADLVKTLTRGDLASLTLNYITKLTSLQQKSLEDAVYGDDNSQTLQAVYKYQVMGIHADGSALDNFGATQMATKAESVTVFDRVLHGLQNNIDGANFYEKHASVLKSEGIVDNNINVTDLETRGGVIMMMYRHELKK